MGISCKMCGTENGDGTKFCSACGNALEAAGNAGSSASAAKGGGHKTMMMSPAPKAKTEAVPMAAPSSTQPAQAQAPASAMSKRTVMGIPAVTADAALQAQSSSAKAPPFAVPGKVGGAKTDPPAAGASQTPKSAPAKTMLGMAAVTGPAPSPAAQAQPVLKPISEPPAPAKPTSRPPSGVGNKTMLGMPAVGFDAPPEKPATPSKAPKTEPLSAVSDKAASDRSASDKPAKTSRPAPSPATDVMPAHRESEPTRPKKKSQRVRDAAPAFGASSLRDSEFDDSEEPPKNRGMIVAVAVAGTVVLAALAVIIYLTVFDKSSGIRPQIFPSADGKSVTVGLPFPDAKPGAVIQAMGQSVPVEQGQARLTISMSQIKLGTNEIPLTYTEPGESPEQMTFPIVLRHSIVDDFGGLVTENPFITVAFQIAPGVRLTVDGKPVQVVNNAYFHKINLADLPEGKESDGDFTMVKLPFQLIDESGAVEQGEHVVAVPLTKLQIDRPAPSATVIADSVTCSGITDEGAQITVNGNPAAVTVKSFSTVVPLPNMGVHKISVVARAPGKAPRKTELTVTRIESLGPAVEAWSKDLDTKLDYPTVGRDPNAAVGKKIKLNGRVVNISTEKGVTAFILYVGDGCPARSKCAVYVVFRGETDAGLQSWVDVYGTVRGTRAVEMQNGVKIEVPAVDAAFVLETENRTKASKH